MANPWDGATYQSGCIAPGIANSEIGCATKKGTSEIYFSFDGGYQTWSSTPVLVGTVPAGQSKVCRAYLEKDGSVVVTNGSDWTRVSSEYGQAGSWVDG